MSLDALTSSLKAKTLPLWWWKLVMTCKALAAPVIGVVLGWILMELGPTAYINLGNRVDQIVLISVALICTVVAGCSAFFWHNRLEDRFVWFVSIVLSTATGILASIVLFELMRASTHAL